jgi:hypothetical protein
MWVCSLFMAVWMDSSVGTAALDGQQSDWISDMKAKVLFGDLKLRSIVRRFFSHEV